MVKVRKNLTGEMFGRLTVLRQTEDYVDCNGKHLAMWTCQCNCKNQTVVEVLGKNLKNGNTQSCGCYQTEVRRRNNKKYNKYDLFEEYGVGYTSNTNEEFYFDINNYDLITDYCWYVHEYDDGYRRLEARDIDEHGVISMAELLGYKWHDHKDRNPLNNRTKNLRPATPGENARNCSVGKNNTSGVIGVGIEQTTQKWRARITKDYKSIYLGLFDSKNDAIRARLLAEKEYFGEFAPQRHLFEEFGIIQGVSQQCESQ